MSNFVRVLRLIEYVGVREDVEKQVSLSLHGTKKGINGIVIRATTLGEFVEDAEGLLKAIAEDSTGGK